ncbi:UbiA prenyltransferase family [Mycena pura]|uniref:4-hydroxybenzoate polyprenyltransferase, mitochondrial n=1 Tax=Mycena pura TaxID=153505 RepID=A0AAD6VCN0_9AGAR|nr:UbiA prenyltransferase family [Mycena pura]
MAAQAKSTWYNYYKLTRLHKFPHGNILSFWPAAWALAMAAFSINLPFRKLLAQTFMFAVRSTLLHSAACILNDICDIDFDRQVERTKNRPLVTGAISVTGATILLSTFVLASIVLLAMCSPSVLLWGLPGIFPFHALYPLMKRWTWWPQAWLGLAMNWSVLVAWISITGRINLQTVGILFAGTICWTIVYDTIYACQDRKDDIAAGIKSTALLFGTYICPILYLFTAAFIACLTYAGISNHQGLPFFLISVGGAVAFFVWQFVTWHVDDVNDCAAKFAANGNLGLIIWVGMILDYYWKTVL